MRAPWVLVLALSCRGAGAFVVHVSSSCALAPNGSALAFDFTFLFNKNPLVCYDPGARLFVPCDWGLLHRHAAIAAWVLNSNATWLQRAQQRRRACQDLAHAFWGAAALRQTPPRVRIVASSVPGTPGTVLTCHAWGFYPPAVTVEWLHDGAVVATGAAAAVLPRGDWTYQTQVPLRVPPRAGGTFTCAVRHASLGRPLRRRWGPGLSPELTEKVAVAAVTMTLGLLIFAAGTFCYCRQGPAAGPGPAPGPAPGSAPAPGSGPHPAPGFAPNPGPGSGLSSGPGSCPGLGFGPSPGPCPGPGFGPSPGPGFGPSPGPGPGPGPHPGPPPATCDRAVTKL